MNGEKDSGFPNGLTDILERREVICPGSRRSRGGKVILHCA